MEQINECNVQCSTCELNEILLLWQFKPTISNQHIKMTESMSSCASKDQHREKYCRPELPIYSSFACALNVHKIAEPEVAKGSSSQFLCCCCCCCCHSSSLSRCCRRHRHQLKSVRFLPETYECRRFNFTRTLV